MNPWTLPQLAELTAVNRRRKSLLPRRGPKAGIFDSLLDGRAAYPSLNERDFHNLGIDSDNYAAQTFEEFGTANGIITSWACEMFVTVIQRATQKSLADENNVVCPYHGNIAGASVRSL